MEPILVIGHRNPDLDSVAAAVTYSELLNLTDEFSRPVQAVLPGRLSPQARYVFERAGVEPPSPLQDLHPRVRDVATRELETVSPETRLGQAFDRLARTRKSMLPVVDDEGQLCSVFSHRSDVHKHLVTLWETPLLGELLDWEDVLQVPRLQRLGGPALEGPVLGKVWVAMEGNPVWKRCAPEDLLIVGGLDFALETYPRAVIVMGAEKYSTQRELPYALLSYGGRLEDLLHCLRLEVKLGRLNLSLPPCLGPDDRVADVEPMVLTSWHALPVVEEGGSLFGIVARADLEDPPRRQVILVDHFEYSQAIPGLENADVIGILDHHRVGDLQTRTPVQVDCRTLGSSCSIVACRYAERGLQPSKAMATLMLGGLVADTLNLRGPTTTEQDRELAASLAERAGLDREAFGFSVLQAGDDVQVSDPGIIWRRDQKEFRIRGIHFSVAQLETVSISSLSEARLLAFRALLANYHLESEEALSILIITDAILRESWMTYFEDERLEGAVKSCFGDTPVQEGSIRCTGLVSRKMQLLPPLLKRLAQMGE